MEFIVEKSDHKHLIIFVHGLNGGATTWKGQPKRFADTLQLHPLIKEHFDLASFVYITKLFQMDGLRKIINLLKGFFANRSKEKIQAFNVGIETVSKPFAAELRSHCEKYDSITIIAHSMGGLVTKSALTWLYDETISEKIKLFFSLEVPHLGAHLAKLGEDILGNNPQILDLKLMGQFTTMLNQRFASLQHLPKIIYTWGHQDTVVPEASAIPNVAQTLTEMTSDDHFSITLIDDIKTNTVFRRLIKELTHLVQPFEGVDVGIPNQTQFQYFVELMASKFKVKVNLDDFHQNERNTKLRGGNISSSSVEDFFAKVGDMAITPLPSYIVVKSKGTSTYKFIKQ